MVSLNAEISKYVVVQVHVVDIKVSNIMPTQTFVPNSKSNFLC